MPGLFAIGAGPIGGNGGVTSAFTQLFRIFSGNAVFDKQEELPAVFDKVTLEAATFDPTLPIPLTIEV